MQDGIIMSWCISDDPDTESVITKYPLFKDFMENLHGSGIDYQWSARETKIKIILKNAFHCMDDSGYYCAVVDFTINIPKDDILNFKISCSSNRYWYTRNALDQYLPDVVYNTLDESIKKGTGMPYKDGFRSIVRYELVCLPVPGAPF